MLAFREDLRAGPGNQYRVLELCGQAAVRRDGRPAVFPHVALDAVASHGQDGFCGEFKANRQRGNQTWLQSSVIVPIVSRVMRTYCECLPFNHLPWHVITCCETRKQNSVLNLAL